MVLFESHVGRQFSDSPRAIYEELVRRNVDLDLIWSFANPSARSDAPRSYIKRDTMAYAEVVARASAIVDNQGLPSWCVKRPGQFHLQTWHGIPLKKMGVHKLEHGRADERALRRIVDQARWDALVCPSKYFENTFVRSYHYRGQLLQGGTPRNDILINSPGPDPEFMAKLDLPTDRRIVLYAPTFREQLNNSRTAARLSIDLDAWVEQFGDTHFLLIRSHYLNKFSLSRKHAAYVMDVSQVDEVSSLYRASDLLVTDFSSAMFDYAWLDRPIVIFAPDYDEYVSATRGTYFDLRVSNPGYFCESQPELHDIVASVNNADDWLQQLHAFRNRYCGVEDGQASVRAADLILEVLGR